MSASLSSLLLSTPLFRSQGWSLNNECAKFCKVWWPFKAPWNGGTRECGHSSLRFQNWKEDWKEEDSCNAVQRYMTVGNCRGLWKAGEFCFLALLRCATVNTTGDSLLVCNHKDVVWILKHCMLCVLLVPRSCIGIRLLLDCTVKRPLSFLCVYIYMI